MASGRRAAFQIVSHCRYFTHTKFIHIFPAQPRWKAKGRLQLELVGVGKNYVGRR